MRLARSAASAADGLYSEINVEVQMKSRSRESQSSFVRKGFNSSEVELSAIALLCLLFAWPPEESDDGRVRSPEA